MVSEPWVHVFLGCAGGYIGYNYDKWQENLLFAVNEKRVERGLVAISRENVVSFSLGSLGSDTGNSSTDSSSTTSSSSSSS